MFESPTVREDDEEAGVAGATIEATLEARVRPLGLGDGRGRVSRLIGASSAEARQVLEAARIEAGLTKSELARRTGVSAAAVTKLSRGRGPRLALVTAARWLGACGYDVMAVRR